MSKDLGIKNPFPEDTLLVSYLQLTSRLTFFSFSGGGRVYGISGWKVGYYSIVV